MMTVHDYLHNMLSLLNPSLTFLILHNPFLHFLILHNPFLHFLFLFNPFLYISHPSSSFIQSFSSSLISYYYLFHPSSCLISSISSFLIKNELFNYKKNHQVKQLQNQNPIVNFNRANVIVGSHNLLNYST